MHNHGAPELHANASLHKKFRAFVLTFVDTLLARNWDHNTKLINIRCGLHNVQVGIDSL